MVWEYNNRHRTAVKLWKFGLAETEADGPKLIQIREGHYNAQI